MEMHKEFEALFEHMEDHDNNDLGILGRAYKLIDVAHEYIQSSNYLLSIGLTGSEAYYYYVNWQERKLTE